ncbi:MAG: hypothetical protein ACOY58_01065 [Candidatus Micrarchaeota archaeon]
MVTATKEPTELEARVAAARYGDLEAYAQAVHGLKFRPYQPSWGEGLETLDRVVIVCPPDTYKSSTVRLFVERLIGKDPNIRVLWLMGTGEQAVKQVMAVASTIRGNLVYRKAFGVKQDTDAQWTKNVLFVERDRFGPDPTLMATGIDGPYQGLHFDLIVIDDPTTPQDVRSPTEMDAQRTMVRGMILDRLVEGGRIVVILTRWGENDLVPTFEEMGFSIITMPVFGDYDWGPTLDPERFSEAKIAQLQKDKGDVLFNLTYMCDASAAEGYAVKRGHILYWDETSLPTAPLVLFMGVDPAASTRTRADYSSISVVGLDVRTRKKYLVECTAQRMEVPDLRAEIVKRARKMAGLRAIGLETVGFQLSLMQDLKRVEGLPIVEVPYRSRRQVMHKALGMDRDKYSRALYLDSQFTSSRLYIPRNLPLLEGVSYESEICSVSNDKRSGKHDDRLDSSVIACTLADTVGRPKVSLKMRGW